MGGFECATWRKETTSDYVGVSGFHIGYETLSDVASQALLFGPTGLRRSTKQHTQSQKE